MGTYPKIGRRGIFCLEGTWEEDLRDRSSVLPTLQLVEALGLSSFIHRRVGTREQLFHYLDRARAKTRYAHFEVLHLAFHGERGCLLPNQREEVSLDELAEAIAEITARRSVEIVYFGSCSTMAVGEDALEEFLRASGVRHVAGYTKAVDWIQAAGFELMVLEALVDFSRVGDALNYLQRGAVGDFGESLGFRRYSR